MSLCSDGGIGLLKVALVFSVACKCSDWVVVEVGNIC